MFTCMFTGMSRRRALGGCNIKEHTLSFRETNNYTNWSRFCQVYLLYASTLVRSSMQQLWMPRKTTLVLMHLLISIDYFSPYTCHFSQSCNGTRSVWKDLREYMQVIGPVIFKNDAHQLTQKQTQVLHNIIVILFIQS